MNDRQINRLIMFRAVSDFLTANAEVVFTVPALQKLAEKLKSKVSDIEDAAEKHATITKGKTDAKIDAQERLIDLLKAVSSVLRTYAHHHGDFETKAVASMREWQFRSLRNEEQLRHAAVILAALDKVSADLVEYGITPEVLSAYRSAVTGFERSMLARDAGVSERTVTHAGIATLILEVGTLLAEELDQMMQLIRREHPKIYDGYKAVRVTKSLGVRYRKNGGNGSGTPSDMEAQRNGESISTPAPMPEVSPENAG